MPPLTPEALRKTAELACLLEVNAAKPGNVTPHHDFDGTTYQDFIASARAIGPAFSRAAEASVGETIFQAIQGTSRTVTSNTNLGMVLLLAPLAKAAAAQSGGQMRSELSRVLRTLTMDDARLTYEAIRLAAPSGLGRVDQQDVSSEPNEITLLQAMELARKRDLIAREYVTDYEITFSTGLPVLRHTLLQEDCSLNQAIIHTFLSILASYPDSLIERKEGAEAAASVSRQAARILSAGSVFSNKGKRSIEDFDKHLRKRGNRLNPGTTADLTAATLFVFLVCNSQPGLWQQPPTSVSCLLEA